MFAEQLTQLIVVVAVLVVAYFGVMVWTRRIKKDEGTPAANLHVGGPSDDDFNVEMPKPRSGPDRNKGRFKLQGRDAEVAAKVLKRMLKSGSDGDGKPGG